MKLPNAARRVSTFKISNLVGIISVVVFLVAIPSAYAYTGSVSYRFYANTFTTSGIPTAGGAEAVGHFGNINNGELLATMTFDVDFSLLDGFQGVDSNGEHFWGGGVVTSLWMNTFSDHGDALTLSGLTLYDYGYDQNPYNASRRYSMVDAGLSAISGGTYFVKDAGDPAGLESMSGEAAGLLLPHYACPANNTGGCPDVTGNIQFLALESVNYDWLQLSGFGGGSSRIYGNWTYYGYTPSEITAVPLPATAWLFGSALLGLAGITRRRS